LVPAEPTMAADIRGYWVWASRAFRLSFGSGPGGSDATVVDLNGTVGSANPDRRPLISRVLSLLSEGRRDTPVRRGTGCGRAPGLRGKRDVGLAAPRPGLALVAYL
jgi:hypothetical protein